MAGFMYRENRVPHYQRLFQKHDGVRQWNQTPRSKYLLLPYYCLLWGTSAGATYMMCRQFLGYKTWFSSS